MSLRRAALLERHSPRARRRLAALLEQIPVHHSPRARRRFAALQIRVRHSPRLRRRLRSLARMPCLAALAVLTLACSPPATAERVADPPRDPAPPAPTCDEVPAGALALLSSTTCPWALVPSDSDVLLRPLSPGGRPLRVAPPDDCRPCSFTGVVTAAGPVVLATRPSAASELADAAWIGASDESAAAPLVFAPLWLDRPALGDSTVQGPPWALAPYVCGASLVLWPEARLPGARAEEPSSALARAAGVYAPAGRELLRRESPVPRDMSSCTRVPLDPP